MGCNCGSNKMSVTKFRLTRPDGTYSDFNSLDEARSVNDAELSGAGVIRTERVVGSKT